ncbi:MAG: hypothetical protein JO124_03265 [Hyphomicrobiales bacterium]|nr:hypothetical protein [Hyphomicrobiales bacterium]MBV9051550.1 hypothetical protein [Hyphomicrobiales bacterium]MBV9974557.1 hypothetical protein [Hyphomicrobiales bacterium]
MQNGFIKERLAARNAARGMLGIAAHLDEQLIEARRECADMSLPISAKSGRPMQ